MTSLSHITNWKFWFPLIPDEFSNFTDCLTNVFLQLVSSNQDLVKFCVLHLIVLLKLIIQNSPPFFSSPAVDSLETWSARSLVQSRVVSHLVYFLRMSVNFFLIFYKWTLTSVYFD